MGLINREQGEQWKHVKEGAPSILMCHPKCPRSFLHLYYLQAFVPLALPILSGYLKLYTYFSCFVLITILRMKDERM